MVDLRLVGYLIGIMVAILGVTMLVPMLLDIVHHEESWIVFFQSAIWTVLFGLVLALSCKNASSQMMDRRQTFILAVAVWVILPVFAGLPLSLGATNLRFVDSFMESMSAFTTTGLTVLSGLETLPKSLLLWRAMLQWFGGIGIIVGAMIFLPELRVGGMQIFQSESFDTLEKILPRATEISKQIFIAYVFLSISCMLVYFALGMNGFDAITHAMTTIATGGMANYDSSFANFHWAIHYATSLFMILAALPFVRYIQLMAGTARPFFYDSQIRAFLVIISVVVLCLTLWQYTQLGTSLEESFRRALFNVISITTGTGYASTDYTLWGGFVVVVFFLIGLIGGCSCSTSCSVKVFRYQILFSTIKVQMYRIYNPSGIFTPYYQSRPVSDEVLSSVMAFFMMFIVSIGGLSVLLGMTGLDLITAVSGAATVLTNVGPGLGPEIGPSGNFAGINDTAKWLLSAGMLVGRLELLVVYVMFTRNFWRN